VLMSVVKTIEKMLRAMIMVIAAITAVGGLITGDLTYTVITLLLLIYLKVDSIESAEKEKEG